MNSIESYDKVVSIMNLSPFTNALVFILLAWSTGIKGIALWRAANLKQKNWFIVILLVNLFGIIELIYLFKFASKKLTFKEIKSWFSK